MSTEYETKSLTNPDTFHDADGHLKLDDFIKDLQAKLAKLEGATEELRRRALLDLLEGAVFQVETDAEGMMAHWGRVCDALRTSDGENMKSFTVTAHRLKEDAELEG